MENSYGLYVGNLTWWTTDQDVIKAINSAGVNDVQEVKFSENRINGQSKGYCVVIFESESSLPIVMEKLPKLELHGQNPVVAPYNRQNLHLFESQTKTRPQISSNNGPNSHAAGIMGISSISGVHAGTQGLGPYAQPGPGVGGAGLGVPGGGLVGPRAPSWPVDGGWSGNQHHHTGMMPRLPMRAPRPVGMRGSIPSAMNNGPMIPGGHQMNWMPRFTPPQQTWNNFQQRGDDSRSMRRDDGPSLRRDDGLSMRRDEGSSLRRDEGSSMRRDEGSSSSLRREEGSSSRRDEGSSSSRRDEGSSSRREEGSSSSSRREERREERSRREESSREKSSRREKSHRSDERARSRSRDRSRERKERRERKSRY